MNLADTLANDPTTILELRPSGGNVDRQSFESVHGVKNPSNCPPQNDDLNLLSDDVHEVRPGPTYSPPQKIDTFCVCSKLEKCINLWRVNLWRRTGHGHLNLEGFRFSMFFSKSKVQLKTQHSYDISIIAVIQFRCDLYSSSGIQVLFM